MNEKLIKQLLEEIQQTSQTPETIEKPNIANVLIWMKKQAYEPTTIKDKCKVLRYLERNCNTAKPEEVKLFIANKDVSNARKEALIEAYNIAIKSMGLTWNKPFYQRQDKKRRAPKEELVQFIINHVKFPLNLKLKMTRDLGERPIELTWLKLQDIDLTTGKVDLTGAKHTIGREGKIRADTIELLKRYVERENLTFKSVIFPINSDALSEEYRHARNRLAEKHSMPELKQIQLYDFRRRKGTREYKLSGNNFLHVKKILGHKDTRSTEKYITEDEPINWIPFKATTDEQIAEAIRQEWRIHAVMPDGAIWYQKST